MISTQPVGDGGGFWAGGASSRIGISIRFFLRCKRQHRGYDPKIQWKSLSREVLAPDELSRQPGVFSIAHDDLHYQHRVAGLWRFCRGDAVLLERWRAIKDMQIIPNVMQYIQYHWKNVEVISRLKRDARRELVRPVRQGAIGHALM